MPSDINPFEPWRPPRDPNAPPPGPFPDDDMLRPWREARRRVPGIDEDPESPESSQTRPGVADEPRPVSGIAFVWITIVLIVLALIMWAVHGATHLSRVGVSAAALWLGLLAALVIGREWRWYWRLCCPIVGAIMMIVCWFFVPTTEGNNLIYAETVLARARTLALGDDAEFNAAALERKTIAQDYPRFREDLREAERAWVVGTVNEAVQAAQQERAGGPAAAAERLRQVNAAALKTEHYREVSHRLLLARQETLRLRCIRLKREWSRQTAELQFATVAARIREANDELGPEAGELNQWEDVKSELREARLRNAKAWLTDAERQLTALNKQEKYTDVAVQGKRLTAELQPEVVVLNAQELLTQLLKIETIRKEALTRRVALAKAEVSKLVAAGEGEKATESALRFMDELRAEDAELGGMVQVTTAFTDLRKQALTLRAAKVATALEKLHEKGEYAQVAKVGDAEIKALSGEGDVLKTPEWNAPILAMRRKSWTARLDVARSAALEHVRKKDFAAMARDAEKVHTDLLAEAESLGLRGELDKFQAVCRFYAKLAK